MSTNTHAEFIPHTGTRYVEERHQVVFDCVRCWNTGEIAFEAVLQAHRESPLPRYWTTLMVVELAGWKRTVGGDWLCPACVEASPAFYALIQATNK